MPIYDDLRTQDVPFHYTFSKMAGGVSQIFTADTIYKMEDKHNNIIKDFENEFNMYQYSIDAIQHPDLVNFIRAGCHYNGTIDFEALKLKVQNLNFTDKEKLKSLNFKL